MQWKEKFYSYGVEFIEFENFSEFLFLCYFMRHLRRRVVRWTVDAFKPSDSTQIVKTIEIFHSR